MPRPWSEYSRRDLARVRPLIERLSYARYAAQVAALERRPALHGDPEAVRRGISGRNVIVTVAFDQPQYVAWQAKLARRHLPPLVHVVVDNSSDTGAASAIEAEAAAAGSAYLRLQPGPWRRPEEGGRSHGAAMNWAWRNILRPGRPARFGFLDHDIFPLAPTDPFAPLAGHVVAGQVRNRSGRERWYLWAGFCFFRFDAAERWGLDFSLDWKAGLDTGGANWFRLYRRLAPGEVCDAGVEHEAIDPSLPTDIARLERIGPWLHAGDFNTPLTLPGPVRAEIAARKRAVVTARIAAALQEGPSAR